MIILELYKRDWNSKYVQYDPTKWAVSIIYSKGGLDVDAMSYDAKETRSYGCFENVHIRTTPIPDYISKSDIETWD